MKTLTLYERCRQIRKKINSGVRVPAPDLMMNSGARRTQSKRDLLASLEKQRQDAGRDVVFKAKF